MPEIKVINYMGNKFVIKHLEKCPVCGTQMKIELKEWDKKSKILNVIYKCPRGHKSIPSSIKDFEIR